MRQLAIGKKSLSVPTMVPSISSFETQLAAPVALTIQNILREPISLVSAFDLKEPIAELEMMCSKFREAHILMLDSGGYESSRIRRYEPNAWPSWNFESFKAVCKRVPSDLVFSFDYFVEQNESAADFELRLLGELSEHLSFLKTHQLIPVVHLQSASGEKRLSEADSINLVSRVASELGSTLVAIPERELGPGLIAKTKLVKKINARTQSNGSGPALHVLGCGNLLSFAFLAAAGAEVFDGLEWCRTCVASDFHLHHFQQSELFDRPDDEIRNPNAEWLLGRNLGYAANVGIRNLCALQSYTTGLHFELSNGTISTFVRNNFGQVASNAFETAMQ